MILYKINNYGYYDNHSIELDDKDPIPFGYADIEPPTLEENVYARWTGSEWIETSISPSDYKLSQEQKSIDPAQIERENVIKWNELRSIRNQLLAESDWSMMFDSPLSDEKKQEWITYRKSLRDLPDTQTDPFNIVWPTAPN